MRVHNNLGSAHRARAVAALEAVVVNLADCQPSPRHSDDDRLLSLERGEGDVEALRVRLRKDEVRVFVATRLGGKIRRTSFVEHLHGDHSAGPATLEQVVLRFSGWRRYLDDVPSDDALRSMQEKRSIVVKAVAGAACLLDERWKTLWIQPAFRTKPPQVLLGDPSGRTSAFRVSGSEGESFGTMSDGLARELSVMSDHMFVTAAKPISSPGIQIEFGPLPGIRVVNDLSSLDVLHSMRHAERLGLRLLP